MQSNSPYPIRLRECPFCGAESQEVFRNPERGEDAVHCQCGARAPVNVWNATPPSSPRDHVFAAISSERDYQASKWGEVNHEVDAFASYIQEYTNQLMHIVGTSDDTSAKLDALRKVGALAVACMEQHGAPRRKGF